MCLNDFIGRKFTIYVCQSTGALYSAVIAIFDLMMPFCQLISFYGAENEPVKIINLFCCGYLYNDIVARRGKCHHLANYRFCILINTRECFISFN